MISGKVSLCLWAWLILALNSDAPAHCLLSAVIQCATQSYNSKGGFSTIFLVLFLFFVVLSSIFKDSLKSQFSLS